MKKLVVLSAVSAFTAFAWTPIAQGKPFDTFVVDVDGMATADDCGSDEAADFTSTLPLATHGSPKPMPLAGTDQASEPKADSKPPAKKRSAGSEATAAASSRQPAVEKESPPDSSPVADKKAEETKSGVAAKPKKETVREKSQSGKEPGAEAAQPDNARRKENEAADSKPAKMEKKETRVVYSSSPTQDKSGPGRRDDW